MRQEKPPQKDCLLVQWASGEYERLLRLTGAIHRAYCAHHAIEYLPVYGNPIALGGRHPFWTKVPLIRQGLDEGYRHVVWLDADCLIVGEDDLRCAVDEGIGAAWHETHWAPDVCYDHYNCGALYLANAPETRAFVDAWLATDDEGHPWHDQHAFNLLARNGAIPCRVQRLDAVWNSVYPRYQAEHPIVQAWHGYGDVEERFQAMAEAIAGCEAPKEENSEIST